MARFTSFYQPSHTNKKKGDYWAVIPLEGLPVEARLTLAYLEHGTWLLSPNIAPLPLQALHFAKITKRAENNPSRLAIRASCRHLVATARRWRDLHIIGEALDPRLEPADKRLNYARHLFHLAWPYDQDPFLFAPCEWEKRERDIAAAIGQPIIGPLQPPSNEPPLIPQGTYFEELPDPKTEKLGEITDIMSNWKK